MANAVLARIVPKSIGNPKVITTLAADDPRKEILLGRLIGIIRGPSIRKDPTGEKIVAVGLKGQFRATPADKARDGDPTESGVLYLPDYVQDEIVAMFVDMSALRNNVYKELEPQPAPIQLAMDVYTIKATNPQGYSWKFVPVLEPTQVSQQDPLAMIEAAITAQAAPKAIEAPAKAKK